MGSGLGLLFQDIRNLETAQDGQGIRDMVNESLKDLLGSRELPNRHVAVLVFDAKTDLQVPGIVGRSAISDGLGIIGSRSLYTLPSCIEEIVPTVCGMLYDLHSESDSGAVVHRLYAYWRGESK